MSIEIKVPSPGESITEVLISTWMKKPGDPVKTGDVLVTIESEKAGMDITAPANGTLKEVLRKNGETVNVGDVIGILDEGASTAGSGSDAPAREQSSPEPKESSKPPVSQSPAPAPAMDKEAVSQRRGVMPSAQRMLGEAGIASESVKGTGPGGRVLKEDAMRALAQAQTGGQGSTVNVDQADPSRIEEAVTTSMVRRTIAKRLVEAQSSAALLTTFNEIDMSTVMDLRKQYQEAFQEKYGLKLGFMSFFVKAVVEALRFIPAINAEFRGETIIYKNYHDVGIAVGGGKGLVVPIIRNAERLGFAEIEKTIADFGKRAQANQIKPDELKGGTFTISNGGVYGSLLSTPIVNPPQSGILGLHAIQDRPVAREKDGTKEKEVVIRPMMYVALTYDHRIVDGREAVLFLKRVKEIMENPARMLLEI